LNEIDPKGTALIFWNAIKNDVRHKLLSWGISIIDNGNEFLFTIKGKQFKIELKEI